MEDRGRCHASMFSHRAGPEAGR